MSLSPRPEMFTITTSDFFIRGARLITSATACADSSAGMMPSVRASTVQAPRASLSDDETYSPQHRAGPEAIHDERRNVLGAACVFQPGMLRPNRRIIQPGRDGVRRRNLS